MPKNKPIPEKPLSDELVLAAIDRATRHQRRDDGMGVLLSRIKEHLGLPGHGWSTRRLLPRLEELQAAGQLTSSRRQSVNLWALTSIGREQLALPAQPDKSASCRSRRNTDSGKRPGLSPASESMGSATTYVERSRRPPACSKRQGTYPPTSGLGSASAYTTLAGSSGQPHTASPSGPSPTTRSQT